MELSEYTISVLRNFNTINSNMLFLKGNQIKTIMESSAIMASATVDVDFPQEFGIYDLGEFLKTISLVSNPRLNFSKDGKSVTIEDSSGLSRAKYYFTDKMMLKYPENDLKMPQTEVYFSLSESVHRKLISAASTFNYETIAVTPQDGSLRLSVSDVNNRTSHDFSIDIDGEYPDDVSFKFILDIKNLRLLPGDYYVKISKKLVAEFTHEEKPLTYWVALNKDSKYE